MDYLPLYSTLLQSFIFLKLAVAGDLTVFVAGTKSNFWTIKPARPLLLAAISSQLTAILKVYGILFSPLGWELAILVWCYAFVAFLIANFHKTPFYRLFGSRWDNSP